MMDNFEVDSQQETVRGELLDVRDTGWLAFQIANEAHGEGGEASELAFGPLEFSIERSTGRVLAIAGYIGEPIIGSTFAVPTNTPINGQLIYKGEQPPAGVIHRFGNQISERIHSNSDRTSYWAGTFPSDAIIIEFLAGCIAFLADGQIVGVLLTPRRIVADADL